MSNRRYLMPLRCSHFMDLILPEDRFCCPSLISFHIFLLFQTPLHLAALRGNTEVVQYLISDCGADTTKRDRNGLNPLELSVKKSQLKTEWSIRRLTHSGPLAVFLSLGRKRLMDSKYVNKFLLLFLLLNYIHFCTHCTISRSSSVFQKIICRD